MSLFGPSRQVLRERDELRAERDRLLGEVEALRAEGERLRAGLEALEIDRYLLLAALRRLRPGMMPAEVGEALADLTVPTLGLATFYLALLDRDQDILSFPYYHEGGKARKYSSRRYSDKPGISGHVLQRNAPLYTRNLEDAISLGAILTEAEKASGLVPLSWYGVPLGFGNLAGGLVAFEHFQADAFSEARRQTLDALGRMASLVLAGSDVSGIR